jgi:hypothetical protein
MSVQGRFQGSLRINHAPIPYQRNFTHSFTLTDGDGPSPGLIIATPAGTEVDITLLSNPTVGVVINYSTTETIELGIWNVDQSEFYPFMRVPPGRAYPWWPSPNVLGEYGTGTSSDLTGQSNQLRVKTLGVDSASVSIELFEE